MTESINPKTKEVMWIDDVLDILKEEYPSQDNLEDILAGVEEKFMTLNSATKTDILIYLMGHIVRLELKEGG
jgi:hypothetical protein